jgi:2-oxoglutarate ferredoxin oxidoreductase subunit alpha
VNRVSLKIVGASGQGINSIGEVLAKGLKRAGYCIFGYREYPSLIKGGHASYQLDVSDTLLGSSERRVDVLVSLNHHGLQVNLPDLKEGGILIHSTQGWKFGTEEEALLQQRKIRVVYLPVETILQKLKAKAILGNVLIAAFVWKVLGCDREALKTFVGRRFAKKKDLLELNMRCIEEGYGFSDASAGAVSVTLPAAQEKWKDHLLLTGNHAVGLGAIHAGVRVYAGYPMTPSSPILTYIAEQQNKTGMVIKQAEDEITAAQMVSGAMLMGARALTATSGGGFDLMAETLSLNGLLENPTVFILAQRPGPATGLPTWTAQADLLMAVHGAHGEFPRCVMAVSGSQDAFLIMAEAFNIAEEHQISVIVLTDKQLGEALYTQQPYDQTQTQLRRGKLVTDPAELASLKPSDRYDPSVPDGISKRWLPGAKAATFCAQGDEHTPEGASSETAENARAQMEKRMRKMEGLRQALPDPQIITAEGEKEGAWEPTGDLDLLLVSWGSNASLIFDVLRSPELRGKNVAYLHYACLWPLKTETLERLAKKAKRTALVECNAQGQLGQLIRMECGLAIPDKILKYDGRPFFYDELLDRLSLLLSPQS